MALVAVRLIAGCPATGGDAPGRTLRIATAIGDEWKRGA